MNTTMSHGFIRFVAGPIAVAGLIGGATLGIAAAANASTTPVPNPLRQSAAHAHSAPQTRATDGGGLMQGTNAGGLMIWVATGHTE